jgi:hypothetical protein
MPNVPHISVTYPRESGTAVSQPTLARRASRSPSDGPILIADTKRLFQNRLNATL